MIPRPVRGAAALLPGSSRLGRGSQVIGLDRPASSKTPDRIDQSIRRGYSLAVASGRFAVRIGNPYHFAFISPKKA